MNVTNCHGCGACCRSIGLPPFMYGEILALPEKLKSEMMAWQKDKHIKEASGDACVWYDADTRLCKHHEHRPEICKDFVVGDMFCLNYRRIYQIDETPPTS